MFRNKLFYSISTVQKEDLCYLCVSSSISIAACLFVYPDRHLSPGGFKPTMLSGHINKWDQENDTFYGKFTLARLEEKTIAECVMEVKRTGGRHAFEQRVTSMFNAPTHPLCSKCIRMCVYMSLEDSLI
ncbi:hypothetical protein TNIN_244441 [Trichonephila inaurata madagascariensis]|uniref:Uncharacterized protein n=1 Tax=Trichonephila inaurata madagascariensis TaxID=2747483 RepID=A0A8X6WS00_9ARAC|nr:hypothetical protein TNIN_244441 [Trichonephila inaurata madagascariensis]